MLLAIIISFSRNHLSNKEGDLTKYQSIIELNMFNTAKNWLSYIYLQYEFSTCIYMFEPWERKAIHSVVIAIILLITFSSYMYLPGYTESLFNFLSTTPKQIESHLQQPQIIPIS